MANNSKLPRDEDGKLSAYAWPGGYDILYLDKDNIILCADCANVADQDKEEWPDFAPCNYFILEEGEEWCENCGAHFGEPIEDDGINPDDYDDIEYHGAH